MKWWGFSFFAALFVAQAALAASPKLDFLTEKLAADRQIDPTQDEKWERREIDALVNSASALAGPGADAPRTLDAVRAVIYQSGPWNGNRPFDYNHDEAHFKAITTTLLSTYLRTRLGNCVSMPILFLIVADRLGLNVELTRAPHHLLIHYTRPDGQTFLLEPTSGAHGQKVGWIRYLMPMTDEAVKNGVYLSNLSREQTVAEFGDVLLEWAIADHRYEKAITLANQLLKADPRNAPAVAWKAISYRRMIADEFESKFLLKSMYRDMPRYQELLIANLDNYRQAEAMGWRSDEELPLNMDGWKLPVAEIRRLCPTC